MEQVIAAYSGKPRVSTAFLSSGSRRVFRPEQRCDSAAGVFPASRVLPHCCPAQRPCATCSDAVLVLLASVKTDVGLIAKKRRLSNHVC